MAHIGRHIFFQFNTPSRSRTRVRHFDGDPQIIATKYRCIGLLVDHKLGLGTHGSHRRLYRECDACDGAEFPFGFRNEIHREYLFAPGLHVTELPEQFARRIGLSRWTCADQFRSLGHSIMHVDIERGRVANIANEQRESRGYSHLDFCRSSFLNIHAWVLRTVQVTNTGSWAR